MTSVNKAKVRELKEKISDQKEKIETLGTYYDEKIDKLDSKKQSLELKASGLKFIPGASNKADQKLEEMKAVSEELLEMKKKKREEIAEAKKELEKLKTEYNNAKNELKSVKAEKPNSENVKDSFTKKIQRYNFVRIGIIIGAIGLFFAIISLAGIGHGNASGVSIFTIIIGVIAAAFSVPAFLAERKEKKKFVKAVIGLSLTGVTILSAIIAIIADPIAVNARCSVFNSKEEMSLGESSICRERVKQLEQQKQDEENAKKETAKRAKDECSAKNYEWNSDKNRCNTEEEQSKYETEKKAKSECSAKNYDWNSSEKRCNTDSEQQAKNAEREAEKQRQEEANKTTTITGKDHDANDMAGKFNKIADACWDKLEKFWTGGVSILDSDDGYPITYSATIKNDGTIVEGSMTGYYQTKGGKLKPLSCSYKNGSVKISGVE